MRQPYLEDKPMRNALVLVFSTGLLCACSGPMGPIPGGELEGTPTPWPEDWAFTDAVENVLLQTNPMDPYSVTVWMVNVENEIYIAAADTDSAWAQNMFQDPSVVLSVNGMLFNATARNVSDHDQLSRAVQAYLAKYDIESQEDFVQEGGALFHLQRP
jgi:hypothetical protein